MDGHAPLQLAVVIVNYRTPALVQDCLESLLPELASLNAEAIVVDNASGDESLKILRSWLADCPQEYSEKVRLVASPINGGFSAGNNLGVAQADAHFYLLLNSDTIVRPGAISSLLEAMEADPNIGALGPRLEYLDGRAQVSRFRRRGITSELIRGAQIDLITRLFHSKNTPIELSEPDQDIDWISFACVLLRSDAIRKIGVMDEAFFMYFEDIEYCLRIKEAGYLVKQHLDARVIHLRGGTSSVKKNGNNQKRIPAYFYRSRSRYFTIRGGKAVLLAANIAWCVGRVLRSVKRIGGRGAGRSIPSEWKDLWLGFFARQEQKSSKIIKGSSQAKEA
ncbi:glycosyltransferase family 2 protein [Microbulbifer bruguierae]|uniref:Glycosyltransferase family 2 protein n=1 Tax=Microbulbifer bruguierae TaxID=3029061 RepID=A0ABY8NCU9_9GAMM|nr:glycosyltransferase family 2 protein [Microbulbifer bruguierae]WGL15258.1 glycosyltransferase family 2 protein [Microbulbifer bruguierae]